MSLVCVPLYETLGDDAIEFIIDHSTSSLVAVAGKRAAGLVKGLRKLKKGSLKTVVYWGDIAPKDLEVGPCVCVWYHMELKPSMHASGTCHVGTAH
jgi:long-subunit acyl-CoA synthetase (AMP-forming)